ncbi:hypothetical protein ABZ920_27495 [Streptomyces sp. NPDC046831]|uniref:hypothetical protein n=1 Tax=Streptomyces sp. NPDC046831 TaxID=3154805 RepID=UPI0033F725ED
MGPFHRPHHYICDLVVLAPLVTGTATKQGKSGSAQVQGIFTQRERTVSAFGDSAVKGRLALTFTQSGGELVADFDSNHWGSMPRIVDSLMETFSTYQSKDLLRHLARVIVDAPGDLEDTRAICDGLAMRRGPQDRLRYAEELWNQSRLLLLLGDTSQAAACAVRGAESARRSGLEPGADMAASGAALASALERSRCGRAARQVVDAGGWGPTTDSH